MSDVWQQIKPLEGYTAFTFRRGNYVAASRWDGAYHQWDLFRDTDDGLQRVPGWVFNTLSDSATSTDIHPALSWAEDHIIRERKP